MMATASYVILLLQGFSIRSEDSEQLNLNLADIQRWRSRVDMVERETPTQESVRTLGIVEISSFSDQLLNNLLASVSCAVPRETWARLRDQTLLLSRFSKAVILNWWTKKQQQQRAHRDQSNALIYLMFLEVTWHYSWCNWPISCQSAQTACLRG